MTPEVLVRVARANSLLVARRVMKARERAPMHPRKELVNGEGFPFFGRNYRLLLVDDGDPARIGRVEHPHCTPEYLLVRRGDGVTSHAMRKAIVALYCAMGLQWLQTDSQSFEQRAGVKDLTYAVKDIGRKRWAKYDPRHHRVTFHWAVFALERSLLDCVRAHELGHAVLRGRGGHGPEWQRRVGMLMFDWKACEGRLLEAGRHVWLGDLLTDAVPPPVA